MSFHYRVFLVNTSGANYLAGHADVFDLRMALAMVDHYKTLPGLNLTDEIRIASDDTSTVARWQWSGTAWEKVYPFASSVRNEPTLRGK
jgi:hypothetical protein